MSVKSKMVVGCEEWCSFPGLKIPAVKARVDSGAKTSSLHAYNIHTFKRDDQTWVNFEVHPVQRNRKTIVACEAPVIDRRFVKSSSGDRERRYVISTSMQLGDKIWDVELTLANRDSMGYRMLLGREAMINRVLIDPGESFCQGQRSKSEIARFYGILLKPKKTKPPQ